MVRLFGWLALLARSDISQRRGDLGTAARGRSPAPSNRPPGTGLGRPGRGRRGLPALRGPSPPARRSWRRSLMTVTMMAEAGAGATSALARPRFWAGAVSRWSAREPGAGGEPDGLPAVLAGPEPGPAGLRPLPPAGDGDEDVPVRGVQVGQGLLEHRGRYRTGPGPLRGGLGRGQPRRQARPSWSSASTSNAATAPPDRPMPSPSPPAWKAGALHLVRSRARRCRSAGSGSPRRCVPGRLVLAAGGAPGRGSGCGGRSSP
jgi:hypothetical protein